MIDQIISGAEQAFLATGYDLATMDMVARHAGVARASVYNNFESKEQLFLAVMRRGVGGFLDRAIGHDDSSLSPLERIRAVAVNFLRAATEPASVEIYRTVVAHGTRFPELSTTIHTQGLMRIEERLYSLAVLVGHDRISDPARFAEHLLSQLMGGYFGRRLLGIAAHEADSSAETYVECAIASLLAPNPATASASSRS